MQSPDKLPFSYTSSKVKAISTTAKLQTVEFEVESIRTTLMM